MVKKSTRIAKNAEVLGIKNIPGFLSDNPKAFSPNHPPAKNS